MAIVDAIGALEGRWGEAARPLGRVLAEHVRHGSPLLPGLERVGVDARARRRRAAETRARRLPVLLLFPLVLCTLPAFGLLTVAPIVAGTLSSLDEGRLEASASTPLPSEELPCTSRPSPSTSCLVSLLDRAAGHVAALMRRARAGRRAGGQSTAEYALVLLGAATVALVFIAWAGRSSRIGKLFDSVLDTVIGKV